MGHPDKDAQVRQRQDKQALENMDCARWNKTYFSEESGGRRLHRCAKHRQGGGPWPRVAELGTAWPSLAALGDLNTWDDALEEFDDIVGSWDS